MKQQIYVGFLALGMATASFSGISQPVVAANLSSCTAGTDLGIILNQGTDENAFKTNCAPVTQLGKVQGRSGTNGPTLNGDYEIAIGPNGAQAGLTGQSQIDWNSGTIYSWQLDFNPTSNQATFQVFDNGKGSPTNQITYSYTGSLVSLHFSAFGLVAQADNPSTIITAGTTMNLSVTDITLTGGNSQSFSSSPLSVTATSDPSGSTRWAKNYYTVDNAAFPGAEITQLKGTFSANFTGLNPQDKNGRSSGIGFQIVMYDPPVSVPEPSTILGIGVSAAVGFGAFSKGKFSRKRRKDKDETGN
ncbi:MAG: hypothetical protein RLZZ143_3792 [Cyanobacteriota bacterium]|jgi:hypothetical protein